MALRRSKWVAAAVFLYAAIVQYNDSDALPWLLVYLAAALLSAWTALRPLPRFVPLILAIAALGWMVALLPEVFAERSFTGTEVERESGGLLLVGAWMLVLARDGRT